MVRLDREQITSLRGRLPDSPRWVETRWMLAMDDVEVLSAAAADTENVVVCGLGGELFSVIGEPSMDIVRAAVASAGEDSEWLADAPMPERLSHELAQWDGEEAILHELPAAAEQEAIRRAEIGREDAVIAPMADASPECLTTLPEDLRKQFADAMSRTTLMAAWVGKRPVSFCYAAAVTETWWDVSVDTLAEFRGRGLAAAVAEALVARFAREGKRATWGAVVSNAASLRVAEKLGFVAVDRLSYFESA